MRSEQIKTGVERTPNRSLLYALGYTDEELARPLIGVVSSYNEIVPGHMGLDKIAEAVNLLKKEHVALDRMMGHGGLFYHYQINEQTKGGFIHEEKDFQKTFSRSIDSSDGIFTDSLRRWRCR